MSKHIATYLSTLIFPATAFFLSACSPGSLSINRAATGLVIEFKDNRYNPQNISIKADQTITFKNTSDDLIWPASNIHPTHGIYPELDPQKPIKPGDSWRFTFTKIGVWKYHDHLNPQITGEITIE